MFKIIDLQGAELGEEMRFNTKEEIRQHLGNLHATDCDKYDINPEEIKKWDLQDLLDYGDWAIEECHKEDEIEHLKKTIWKYGHIIRHLDENNEYLEYWTQDGEYNLDGIELN